MRLVLATAAGLAAAGHASAAEFYGAVGYTAVDASNIDLLNAGTVRAGVNATPNIGVEVEYSRGIGSAELGVVDVDLDNQFAGYVVGRLPVADRVEVFGRAGYGVIEFSAEFAGNSDSETVEAFSFGAGVEYDVTDRIAIRADYTRFEANDNDIAGGINAFGLAVVVNI